MCPTIPRSPGDRKESREALAALLVQVLELAGESGLGRVGSLRSTAPGRVVHPVGRTGAARVRDQVDQMLGEADRVDAEEDVLFVAATPSHCPKDCGPGPRGGSGFGRRWRELNRPRRKRRRLRSEGRCSAGPGAGVGGTRDRNVRLPRPAGRTISNGGPRLRSRATRRPPDAAGPSAAPPVRLLRYF